MGRLGGAELLADGLLVLAEADSYGWRRVGASEAGQARYRELCRRQRRSELPVPPEQHPGTESPAGGGAGRGTAGR